MISSLVTGPPIHAYPVDTQGRPATLRTYQEKSPAVAETTRGHGQKGLVSDMTTNSTFVETLRARWISKRNEFIQGKRVPGQIFDGPDGYARRELRAYRLATFWARDESLPGEWWLVRRCTRWDVYPQQEPLRLIRYVPIGNGGLEAGWFDMYYPSGEKARQSDIRVRRADPKPVRS